MSRHKETKRKLPGKGGHPGGAEASQPRHPRRRGPTARMWGTPHLVFALLVGVAIGLGLGVTIGGSSDPAPAADVAATGTTGTVVPQQTTQPAPSSPTFQQPATGPQSLLDAYGRPPSDPHYGHNHP